MHLMLPDYNSVSITNCIKTNARILETVYDRFRSNCELNCDLF